MNPPITLAHAAAIANSSDCISGSIARALK
jgi:hypothetical protein